NAFAADTSLAAEREARRRVEGVIERLGLGDIAHRRVADLPFGVLRMVEVARALVTGFPVIMLDEPASGLDNSETDRLAQMLLDIRDSGVTLLLIEHAVRDGVVSRLIEGDFQLKLSGGVNGSWSGRVPIRILTVVGSTAPRAAWVLSVGLDQPIDLGIAQARPAFDLAGYKGDGTYAIDLPPAGGLSEKALEEGQKKNNV